MTRLSALFSLVILLIMGSVAWTSNEAQAGTNFSVYLPIVIKPATPMHKVAYVSSRDGVGIYLVNADGGGDSPLVVEAGVSNQWPHWSRGGQQLAFRSKTSTALSSVRVIDVPGGTPIDISAPANFPADLQIGWILRWAADDSQVAFYTTGLDSDANSDEIFIANVDGSGVSNITKTPDEDERFLDWSPDGERLVFVNYAEDSTSSYSSIVTIRPNGLDRKTIYGPITNHSLYAPVYSPDNTTIAFTEVESQSGLTGRLILMDTDGSNIRSYQPPLPLWTGLEWSPDGTQLGFIGENNGIMTAFAVGAADGTFKQAVIPTDDFAEVTWSADSKKLLYDAPNTTSGGRDLYIFDLATSTVTPLVTGASSEFVGQGDFSPMEFAP